MARKQHPTARVWECGPDVAAQIETEHLDKLQRNCGGQLTITRTDGGGIRLQPESTEAAERLTEILTRTGAPFTERLARL